MEILEQGSLKLTGAECFGSIADASLHQELGNHGILTATVWLPADVDCEKESSVWKDMPVSLVPAGEGSELVFSGLVKYAAFRNIKGRAAVQIEAYSHTILLDGVARNRSFQQESRTYGELVRSILSPYQAAYIWSREGRDETVGRFLMQYGENDWEFLRRVASFHGHAVVPEVRFPGAKMFIGLPAGRKEAVLEADSYRIKKRLDKTCRRMDNNTTGGLKEGLEIEVNDRYEDYSIGDPVRFLDSQLITAWKHSRLKGNQWVHDYRFRPAADCRMERMDNLRLAGAAVRGSVLGTTPESSRLALVTDQEGEQAESWHIQPVYYAGGGKGYSGQPEKGDTQYLYFPTEREEDRYIIGGADAGAERIMAIVEKAEEQEQAETAAGDSRTGTENGGGNAVSGAGSGTESSGSGGAVPAATGGTTVSVATGGTRAVSSGGMVPVSSGGMASVSSGEAVPVSAGSTGAVSPDKMASVSSDRGSQNGGNASAGTGAGTGTGKLGKGGRTGADDLSKTKNWSTPGSQSLVLNGAGIRLSNGSGNRVSVRDDGIRVTGKGNMELSAEDICLDGLKVSMEAKEYVWLKSQDSSLLLMPDAIHMKAADIYIKSPESGIHPIYEEESAEHIFTMYEEKKKSIPPLYAADGSIIRPSGYDDILYTPEMLEYFEKNVYGKGEYVNPLGQPVQLFYDSWLEEVYGKTELKKFWEHLETVDGIQEMLDVAGLACEPADVLNAGISLCRGDWENMAWSLVGVFPAIGDWIGKGKKGLKRASAGAEAALKAGKTGEKVVDRLEITYKALTGKTDELMKYLDEVAAKMQDAMSSVGPGYRLCFEGTGYYLDDGTELFFKVVDDAGDSVTQTRRLGNAAADGLDGVRDAARYVDEVVESGSTLRITNKFPDEAMPQDGKVIDYYIENGKIKGIEGINNVDFVITTNNRLIIGNKHHYLGNGQDVLAAGQLKINGQGHIKRIDNLSGHYRPTVDESMGYQILFENLGLDLNNTWIEYYRFDIDIDGMVVDTHLDYVQMIGAKE